MAKLSILAFSALVALAAAEPPVSGGYSYSAPSHIELGGGGHGGYSSGGYSSGGHGGYSGGGISSPSQYHAVSSGYQTSEGQHVDYNLLEKIKHIILKDEIHNQQFQEAHSSSGHGISHSYGPPAPVYGVPHDHIVGIELGHITQGIQVAQYEAEDAGYSGGHGGYSSGHGGYASGHGYSSGGASYNTIAIPSGTYGIPSPSSSYGSPHH